MGGDILKQIQLLHAKLDTLKLDAQSMRDETGSPRTSIKKEEEDWH